MNTKKFCSTFSLNKTYKFLPILCVTLFINTSLCNSQVINDYPFNKPDKILEEIDKIRYQYPDSAKKILYGHYGKFIMKDTIRAASFLLKIANISGNNADYAESYDVFWKALLLADNIKNDKLRSSVYRRLGRFYSYSKRKEKSLEYLNNSLNIDKQLIAKGELENADLVINYYLLTSNYRELEYPELANKYIDSSFFYYSENRKIIDRAYLNFEKAVVLSQEKKFDEALGILKDNHDWFLKNNPSYLVLYYKYWGDIYLELSRLNDGEDYYTKALGVATKYKSHIDFTPLIYEKLTELYLQQNDFNKAFHNLKEAKDLDANFFDSRSLGNQSFLEIKDAFRLEKERQEKQIQEQYLKQLEQEDEINNLQLIILIGSLIFLVIFGYLYFKNLKTKHKTEKELLNKTKELEIKKAEELLELKNKELASSALQLIEKEEFLKTLKSTVNKSDDRTKVQEINKVLRTISVSNNRSWEDFRHRFIDVNKDFYNKIFQKFPNLSQTDQKICALIKLNFSSKEMSRLLGISVESVHTSRHRLRKKMGLSRDVNLEEYINML